MEFSVGRRLWKIFFFVFLDFHLVYRCVHACTPIRPEHHTRKRNKRMGYVNEFCKFRIRLKLHELMGWHVGRTLSQASFFNAEHDFEQGKASERHLEASICC